MKAVDLNLFLFAALVVTFAAFGFASVKKQRSVKAYFHDSDLFKNIVSLSATNVTLGTGLVYLVTGAQHNGVLMLLIPLMVFVGYWLVALFLEKATSTVLRTGKNFLASLNDQVSKTTGAESPLARVVSASLVFVYVLVLAFEIFASSKVIAPLLFAAPNVQAEVWLSLIIFAITLLYTILGGITAVFRVDVLQVPLILMFLPVFIGTAMPGITDWEFVKERFTGLLKFDQPVVIAIAIACMNAVLTQFYSILNWGAVSHVDLKNQQRLLKWVGFLTALVLTIFVLAGLLHPVQGEGQVWADITSGYSDLASQSTLTAYAFSGILILGMASVLLTTTDAVVINTIMFWYDNVAKGDSLSTSEKPEEVRKIRTIGAVTFIVCFGALMAISYLQPDPFYLLLSIAGGVTVFAPMIATAGYLCSKDSAARVLTPPVIYTFFAIFILSGIGNAVLLMKKSPFVAYLGAFAFLVSLALSVGLLVAGKKLLNEKLQ